MAAHEEGVGSSSECGKMKKQMTSEHPCSTVTMDTHFPLLSSCPVSWSLLAELWRKLRHEEAELLAQEVWLSSGSYGCTPILKGEPGGEAWQIKQGNGIYWLDAGTRLN